MKNEDENLPEVLEKESKITNSGKNDVIEVQNLQKDNLPQASPSLKVSTSSSDLIKSDPLYLYLKEIEKYHPISLEEEQMLAQTLKETGDIEVAKKLVQANLRLVVKIAMEYRRAWQNVLDLIQEGNIGLMKAVSKYDPDKGAKLSYYASWWIKSYILKYILDNFRLVKIGTTAEQKKLFFNLMKEKERLEKMGQEPTIKLISQNLGVSEKSVKLMDQRLSSTGSEVSFDMPLYEDSNTTVGDMLEDAKSNIESEVSHNQELTILKNKLGEFMQGLKERDKEIFQKRLLSEVPPSLQSIADEYGVSRERIRQIEERLINKLKVYMSEFIR